MPRIPPFLTRALGALAALGFGACVNRSSAAPVPVSIPATPVVGHTDTAPEVASRRIKGALFGHADLQVLSRS